LRRGPLLAALFLAALSLRPQLVGIGPLIPSIQKDLDASHAVVGLLGTVPVLCMGLFAPPAAFLSQRLGSRYALGAALALIGVFGVARGINVGATTSAAAAVPLTHALDSWRDPILVFSAVSIGLAALWLAFTRVERGHIAASVPRPLALPWRNPFAWRLVAAFFFMSSTYYGLNAWLPDVYVERGWSEGRAGALLAVLNATQIVAGLGVTWLADRMGSRRAWMAACAAMLVVSLLGVVLLPSGGFLWAALIGGTIGPLFPLTMALPLDVGRNPADVAAFTGLMLGAGYALSAIAPFVLGAIRDASTGFGAVLWVLVGTSAALLVVDASLTPARLAAARRSHEPPPVAASS
jgi:CP family cyanate transporter-like MFS transporter